MQFLSLEIEYRNHPALDPDFIPLHLFNNAFLEGADKAIGIAVERSDGQISVHETLIRSDKMFREANIYYVSRLVKTLLWLKGGYRIYLSGDKEIYEEIKRQYASDGPRDFDRRFMGDVFEKEFEIVYTSLLPSARETSCEIGRHLTGCRIGFDAGGSDRKVSAVIDGKCVYSEEVVWHPKVQTDPDYHFFGIVEALNTAASYLPRIDGIGISSAGVCIDNRLMVSSLFTGVSPELFSQKGRDIYIRAGKTLGDIPLSVCNDGDVTALSGAMSLHENNVLGIAMGTSQAAGYVNAQGHITGWLNELAFVPVDANPAAMRDEWSGDIGCGVKYFSQDSIIKLATAAGIPMDPGASPAEKLKAVQKRMEQNDADAVAVYTSLGMYLGHTIPLYYDLYRCQTILLLGRVMSGQGGNLILETAQHVLRDEYAELAAAVKVMLPDETFRRVGQSIIAASLPKFER